MKLSAVRVLFKRFAWLWGALSGVVLFPVLMLVCKYVVIHTLPRPRNIWLIKPLNLSFVQFSLTETMPYWVGYAGLGGCGAMLLMGQRSLQWRLLSIVAAVGAPVALLDPLCALYRLFPDAIKAGYYSKWLLCLKAATWAPPLVAALLLLFFALLLRSPKPLATQV